MNIFNRIYELHQLLASSRYPVSRATIQRELECSESTARRTVRQLRDNLGAPLIYDRQRNGYIYQPEENGVFELPGLWFSPQETHALLTAHQLLDSLQPGILSSHINALTTRLKTLLTQHHPGHADIG
ncbi:MAG: HTH domain-containing protein, partial [Gammaproteobacteria bacterium]|nr:HTH domain-containing protein [Gammaproteobacteria bacterium]